MEVNPLLKEKEFKRRKRKETGLAWLLLSPYVIIFVVFTLVPVFLGFIFSFMKYNPFLPEQNSFVGFENYINIFKFDLTVSKTFWNSFLTMLVFDIVAVPLLIIIPLILAYFINMNPPGYKIFRAILYLPSVVSVSIMGIIFGNMFAGNGSGLINAVFGTNISWLSGLPWENDFLRWVVILLASIWWQAGTNFVIFAGALRDVPKSLYEACEINGGNRWHKIVHVTLPNIKPSILICTFTTLIGYMNLYGQPFVLNELDNQSILVSPMMFIQKYLLGGGVYAKQTGYLCAAAIVFGLIVMVVSILQRRIMSKGNRTLTRSIEYERFFKDKLISKEVNNAGEK